MTTRSSSAAILCALAFSFVVAPALLSQAQTAAPADVSSNTAAPATPAPVTPAPAAPAAPVAAPADTTAPAERPATYTMVAGDSLASVAKKFDTSIHALVKLNKIPRSMYRKLPTGKVLQIPPATSDTTTK